MNKIRLLKLLEIFIKYSDDNHFLSLREILSLLEEENIKTERKTLYDDIKLLNSLGYEIEIVKGKIMKYHLLNHPLEEIEAKIIYDAINATNFLTDEKALIINNKILNLLSIYQKEAIIKSSNINKNHIVNKNTLFTINELQNAINNDKYVSFKYFDINIKKEKKYRKQKQDYTLIPYALVLIQQNYYCIFYSDHYKGFANYRVDRIDNLKILTKNAIKTPFDINDYLNKSFNMFSTNRESITVEFDNEVYKLVTDKFGYDLLITAKKENSFIVNFNIAVNHNFYSWLLQFHKNAKIISPDYVVNNFKSFLQSVIDIY